MSVTVRLERRKSSTSPKEQPPQARMLRAVARIVGEARHLDGHRRRWREDATFAEPVPLRPKAAAIVGKADANAPPD